MLLQCDIGVKHDDPVVEKTFLVSQFTNRFEKSFFPSRKSLFRKLGFNPSKGERVKIFNQMTESHQVGELAKKVAALTGAQVNNLPNPRNEAVENDLIVDNRCFIELGLNPTTLDDGLLKEVVEIATRYADRCDRNRILCTSAWTKTQEQAIKAT